MMLCVTWVKSPVTSDEFQVQLTRRAEKDLRRFRSALKQVRSALKQLEVDPFTGHPLSGTLQGVRSLVFTIPGTSCRAAYVVLENERVILVFLIGTRERFYEHAQRRWNAVRKQIGR
jgi:mRNA-degrading endonuclease RelE of RelBE toxin-antitoxin system